MVSAHTLRRPCEPVVSQADAAEHEGYVGAHLQQLLSFYATDPARRSPAGVGPAARDLTYLGLGW